MIDIKRSILSNPNHTNNFCFVFFLCDFIINITTLFLSQTYEGEFFRDRRHGEGIYMWPDESTYSGTFYMDKKEGYGTFTFSNSNKFEVKVLDF